MRGSLRLAPIILHCYIGAVYTQFKGRNGESRMSKLLLSLVLMVCMASRVTNGQGELSCVLA